MPLTFKTIDDVEITGKRVLIRVDMNCSVDPETGRIIDDSRIVAVLPTLKELSSAKVVLMAHQGRPGSDDFISLQQHAQILKNYGINTSFVDDIFGDKAKHAIQNVQIGEMTRFNGINLHKDSQTISITADGEQIVSIQSQQIGLISASIDDPEAAIAAVNSAIEFISSYRGSLGSNMEALESASNALYSKAENVLESASRIADLDVAAANVSMAADQVLVDQACSVQAHSQTIAQIAHMLL